MDYISNIIEKMFVVWYYVLMEINKKVLSSKEFKQFENVFANGKMVHAYLVIGEDGEKSNQQFCWAMIQKLVCSSHSCCGSCAGCKKIEAGFHPDVFVYPKGKSFLVADSEDILENVAIKPMESDYKIFLLNQFDKATVQAQNKLLKTVEEAPNNVVFIFNAVNANNVLQTIKSRTQEIEIPNFEDDNLILENQVDYAFLKDMLENLASSKQTIIYAVKFAEKTGFLQRLKTLANIFEDVLLQGLKGSGKYTGQALTYKPGAIAEILQAITLAKRQFEANVSTNLISDMLLLKILEVRYKWNKN